MESPTDPFLRLVEVIRSLRHPKTGCPWDLEQTHLTLRPYLVEETYEVLEAIEAGDDRELKEELGDVLLQVVLHSQLADERNAFAINDVVRTVTDKMIRRHPHVFGNVAVESSNEVLKNWETIKSAERTEKNVQEKPVSVLDGVPAALPALIRAQRIGEKANRVGFDWESPDQVWQKVEEELKEVLVETAKLPPSTQPLTTAPTDRDPALQTALEHEIGDLLFSVCQYARWLGVSAEDSLRGTVDRFISRFRQMEALSEGTLRGRSTPELDQLWEKAKALLEK
ncbi:MAG: nucleoside triphosphate pyrophosphohydrolase [Bdellovibrionota bacterium]